MNEDRTDNTRRASITARPVDEADMRLAMGPLYDPDLPLPGASYRELSLVDSSRELQMVKTLMLSTDLTESGPARQESWSDAWDELYRKFVESGHDPRTLDPPYVSASHIVRWMGGYARAESPGFEMEVYRYVRETVFRRLMGDAAAVHDVGAGSCFNAVAYCEFNPRARVFTYDWAAASSMIATDLRNHRGLRTYGHVFDFFNPGLTVDPDDVVMTTCAMEQLGDGWGPFLDNLLRARPRRVVHVEPIVEKYADDRGFDSVAREYHTRRNYLRGYYPELLRLHGAGEIEIVCDHRTGVGSRFHECYTVVAWEPR